MRQFSPYNCPILKDKKDTAKVFFIFSPSTEIFTSAIEVASMMIQISDA